MLKPPTKIETARGGNHLAHEKSPYLLQHAQNPVDWYPWGEEAFLRARRENKPVFLSIGYSTCHWCHVMAHESFENPETAAVMNRDFINIKVDREERPDVDRVYMTFVQATTGGGGWPMSVWLTPGLEPFVGGTYFPPEDRYGQPAFKNVLQKIAAAWQQDHEKITAQGSKIVEALRDAQSNQHRRPNEVDAGAMQAAFEQFSSNYDATEGGFGNAPKFPHPVTLNFLSRFYARQPKSDDGQRALEMHRFTLQKMAAGGMHDHLGGGFHRYSVDRSWHVPHFEKMLYDQAQLANAYLDGFLITHDPEFEEITRDILEYVGRDMTSKSGGFFSAEDADSLEVAPSSGMGAGADRGEKHSVKEGAFYVWSKAEIDAALGHGAEIFNFHYGVEPAGNAPAGSDPHGEFSGKNILIQRHTVEETAAHFKREAQEIRELLASSRKQLMALRAKRPRPHLDDKIIAGWNGLIISAYARAAAILQEDRFLQAATRAAEFVRRDLYDKKTKKLYRSFREGRSAIEGFADDYAFVIQGLLDLYEASFDVSMVEVRRRAAGDAGPIISRSRRRLFQHQRSRQKCRPAYEGRERWRGAGAQFGGGLESTSVRSSPRSKGMARAGRAHDRGIPFHSLSISERHAADACDARFSPKQAAADRDCWRHPKPKRRKSCSLRCISISFQTKSCCWPMVGKGKNIWNKNCPLSKK